jgi:iron complex transport system substrate-binding protein
MKKIIVLALTCLFVQFLFVLAAFPATNGKTVNYTDRLGQPVEVKVPCQRVILLESYEILPITQGWDRVVGLSRNAYENDLILAVKPDVAKTIKSPGGIFDSNAESLIELNPDLIITFNYGGRTKDIEFWRSKGLTVLSVYPTTIEELYELMRLHGEVFDARDKIEKAISDMRLIFELIENKLSGLTEAEKKTAYWLFLKPNHVGGRKGLTQTLFDLIKVKNLAPEGSNDSVELPLETINAQNPELIFLWGNAPFKPEDLAANPQWRQVDAIKNNHVYKMPHWSTISPRLAPQALLMASMAYPDRFSDIDVGKVIENFYLSVYGLADSSKVFDFD